MAEDTEASRTTLRVPFEILDDIIDMTVSTLEPRTLSSMALVSQYCRIRANQKRFSSVSSDNAERFKNLASVFISQSQVQGMLHIASFIVYFHYRRGAMSSTPHPFLNGMMTVIFNMLFRPSPYYKPSSKDFVLNLDPSGDNNFDGIPWDRFHPSITPAFMHLCYNSRLTELWLFNIQNIPSGILRYSPTLKHLRLDHVSAAPTRLTVFPGSDSQIVLTSLHVYGSVDFEDVTGILCGKTPTTPNLFLALTELRTVLCTFDDIDTTNQLLAYAPSVQVLSLSVRPVDSFDNDPGDGDGISVRYQNLTSLKKIFLLNLFDARVDSGILPADLVGGQVPRNLEEINIIITDRIDSDEATELFRCIDIPEIDELFSSTHLNTVKRIIVIAQLILERQSQNYSPVSFRDRCIDYIKTKLPQLSARLLPPCLIVSMDIISLNG